MSFPGTNLKGQESSPSDCAYCTCTVFSIAYSGPRWNCEASVATDFQALVELAHQRGFFFSAER